MTRNVQDDRGSALLLAIVFVLIVSAMASAFLALLHMTMTSANRGGHRQECEYLAAGGIEKAMAVLRENPAYTGESDTPLGGGVFSVTVAKSDVPNRFQVSAIAHQEPHPYQHVRVDAVVDLTAAGPRIVAWKESTP